MLSRLATRLVALSERYVPDAFVFALLGTGLVVGAGLLVAPAGQVIDAWGRGFWSLLSFTLQMALIIIAGHVVASAPAAARLIERLAAWPRTGRGAVVTCTLVSLCTSWINWGLSLVFSALLVRAVARQMAQRGVRVDYRALAASSLLGLGSIWAQGLSGSAALQMASPGALPPEIARIVAHGGLVPGGLIPLSRTIFLWQSLLSVAIELVVVTLVMGWVAPQGERAVTAAELGVDLSDPVREPPPAGPLRPGEWLEHTPLLSLLVLALGGTYLVRLLAAAPSRLDAINLSTVNLAFLLGGVLLHWTPARLMHAFARATPAVWSVILQFPFYGGIAGVIGATSLNERLAGLFVSVSSQATFPPLVALYSAVLGVFVPSGGAKWVIEAPYVLGAAHRLGVHLGWMVAAYDLGEALANLVQPFWMVPVLSLLGLRARDVMGYTA
ncbi:MAG: TIGR00366 family protein, partial [Myxococcota bacterium]|nr:TIGR00366 family protein [Myxococcota bacterium]